MTVNLSTYTTNELTEREHETMRHLVGGYAPKETAQRMNLSHNTVQQYIRQAKIQMDARTTYHLVVLYDRAHGEAAA
jgi:DNA-binding CsgD family transcriptional regulator